MAEYMKTVLEMINHAINQHYELAPHLENIAANAQGKGWGTATINDEIVSICGLIAHDVSLAIDIGGNIGNYSAALREHEPNAKIHIFEPSTTNIMKLSDRFINDNNIHIVPVALSDKAGYATLYSNEPGSGLGSLTKRRLTHFSIPFDCMETVNTMTFEEYWKDKLSYHAIDLVKIDAEGHELNILKGFGESFNKIQAIQFEFGGCNIDTRTFFQDFWYLFAETGFDIYRITPSGPKKIHLYSEKDEFFSTTNYIALNRR